MKKIVLILAVITSYPVWAEAQANPFGAVINISADSTENIVLVDKSRQTLYIVRSPGPSRLEVVKTFKVTTGRANGDKQVEGDLKTPEGIYYITGSIPGENLPPKYGPLALILNYPNNVDRLFQRTGSDIWIHGRDEQIQDFLTEGCISLENGNVLNLQQYVEAESTPIIISDSLRIMSDQEYLLMRDYWRRHLETWASSWETGDTLTYFNYYSPKYFDGASNYQQFTDRKARLETIYDWKSVSVDDLVVYYSKREVQVEFIQGYYCPNFYSEGRKRLTLIPGDNAWQIVREDFSPRGATRYAREFITEFLRTWERSWESKNIQNYMDKYHPDFQTEEYNWQGWENYKQEVFEQSGDVTVNLSNISFTSIDRMEWEVTFNQAYSADNYSDYGRKTLVVRGEPDNLQILNETWQAISSE